MSIEALARLGELSEELGARPPATFAELTDEQLAVLSYALRRERERRATGLNEAAEKALTVVPAPARGPVRRILFRSAARPAAGSAAHPAAGPAAGSVTRTSARRADRPSGGDRL
ncbi:hypothetical protein ABT127_00660 [Streptomyces sp. NPDC001904]|uniref:hypothetical protein n=1 Tax=Streptomyces sp. NPDC001904 TaxID=3154531 RepID=UPI00332521A6